MTTIQATIKATANQVWQLYMGEYIRLENYLSRRQRASVYRGRHRLGSMVRVA